MKTRLEKFKVCVDCLSVGTTYNDCVCTYGNYKTVELEFEVCDCCGHLVSDGNPAKTSFNDEKIKKLL